MEIKAVLFPTDFSEGSQRALPYAVDFARTYGAKLYIQHVIYDIALASELNIAFASMEKAYEDMRVWVEKELVDFGSEEKKAVKEVKHVITQGLPDQEIVTFAQENNVDLIVISTYGKSGIDRILVGSTAERVIRNAPCPVFVVRTRHE